MQRQRTSQVIVGALGLVLAVGVGAAAGNGATAEAPTFAEDVAPILYENCVTCHRAGEMAPMSLVTYEEARPWGRSIKNKVMTGEMPPWHADPSVGRFQNERRLTDAERDIIVRWVDAGAPMGALDKLPPVPTFPEGWQIGTPDLVIEMAESFDVPAEGEVAYQSFRMPTNFEEDKWVQAFEVRAGAPSVVHHILAFARVPGGDPRSSAFRFVPVSDRAKAVERMRAERAKARGPRQARPVGATRDLIGVMAPGTNPMTLEPGSAMRVPKGTELIFQIHYTTSGEATSDRSRVGMIFADGPPEREVLVGSFLNPYFEIPAGEANHRVDTLIEFEQDIEIYGLMPHTHLRGKRWEYHMQYPDGRRESVLSVPAYDFNWQTLYEFEEPLSVPKGARLEATAWYDNSLANKSNPDPTSDVRWGSQTWEEMQYTAITYRAKDESDD